MKKGLAGCWQRGEQAGEGDGRREVQFGGRVDEGKGFVVARRKAFS